MERTPLHAVSFVPSGSTILDLAIGGGWAVGRIFNIVGDRSTGKTLLAIESFANFHRMFPQGKMRYGEAESAFDDNFAATLGFPDTVEKPESQIQTVEDFYEDLGKFAGLTFNKDGVVLQKREASNGSPSLYILDSLDALSDASELARGIADGSYGTGKSKQMGALFRRLVKPLSEVNCTLGIISQVRDNVGVAFGEHETRSGGRALDFYASQIVWLSETGKLTREIKGQTRATGVSVKAKCKKCKVGLPFREAHFSILFGYGVDDHLSMTEWLGAISAFTKEEVKDTKKTVDKAREAGDLTLLSEISTKLRQRCATEWEFLEEALRPKVRKYN